MKITKADLDVMNSEQIREFMIYEHMTLLPQHVVEYINNNDGVFDKARKVRRVCTFLNIIVVERFIKQTL